MQRVAGFCSRERRLQIVAHACAPEVELAGASYAEIPVDQAVTDGRLVTAPAWPAHPAWIAQFLAVLGTRIEL